jgi:hypothetical protein
MPSVEIKPQSLSERLETGKTKAAEHNAARTASDVPGKTAAVIA